MTTDLSQELGDGGAEGSALARCVSCPSEEFADHVWGRAPRLTRAAQLPRDFTDLFDPDAVDELVSRRGLRTPFVRMAKDGTVLAGAQYTRSGGRGASIADQVADDRVLVALADGATLVLQALHRNWPPLMEFATRLSGELGHPVQINAYITPPQSRGFAPHYDVHDVFVLQVAGRKQWRIHEPVVQSPLESQPWERYRHQVASRAAETPVIDTVLEPGDTLYLPRGTIHAAVAQGETSIHLTVGVHPLTRRDLMRHLLESMDDDEHLRAPLPMGVDLADPEILAPHVAAAVSALHHHLDRLRATDIATAIGTDLMRQTRPAPLAPLVQLTAAERLQPDVRVRPRPGLRWRIEHQPDGAPRLVLLDRTIAFAAETDEAIKVLATGVAFSPAELPGLDKDGQLELVRQLLREGVVVPA